MSSRAALRGTAERHCVLPELERARLGDLGVSGRHGARGIQASFGGRKGGSAPPAPPAAPPSTAEREPDGRTGTGRWPR